MGDRFAQLADARAVGGDPTGNTLAWRIGYWTEIVPLANRNPVTGIGPNMTQLQTDEAKKPHNDFLRAYVETGVVGLLAYLAMVIAAAARRAAGAAPGAAGYALERGVAVGFLGCAVAFVAVSAASNVISSVATLWYFVAFAAVAGAPALGSGAGGGTGERNCSTSGRRHGDRGLPARRPAGGSGSSSGCRCWPRWSPPPSCCSPRSSTR